MQSAVRDMSIEELALRIAVAEETTNTINERYDKGWVLLREDMAKRDAANPACDASTRWWRTAIILAGIGIATTVIIAVVG